MEDNEETYSERINRLKSRYVTDKNLKKAQSKSILNNECPFCELEWACYQRSMHSPDARLCMRRSTESARVWLYTSDKKPKIEIGKTYGILTIIKFDHKTKHGDLYYSCKCQCGQKVVARSGDILGGKTTSCGCLRGKRNKMIRNRGNKVLGCESQDNKSELTKLYGNSVKVGSMMNPDHTRHVVATEHHSKVGCKVDTLVTVDDKEAPENTYYYFDDAKCIYCGGLLRTNSRAEQECENCHEVSR